MLFRLNLFKRRKAYLWNKLFVDKTKSFSHRYAQVFMTGPEDPAWVLGSPASCILKPVTRILKKHLVIL